MAWRVRVNFDDGTEELVDEEFETREDAECEEQEWYEGWSVGRDVLEYADEEYSDADIESIEIWEE